MAASATETERLDLSGGYEEIGISIKCKTLIQSLGENGLFVEETMAEKATTDIFSDRHKFQDDVWGEIRLNNVERDVIDTPEFQRLFRTSQLGFVDLVYQTANHTRGAHSIGACHVAQKLMERLQKNTKHDIERYAKIEISPAERALIRLGALLHDITHVPFSHDTERKSHLIWYKRDGNDQLKVPSRYGQYEKHDDYGTNPLLFLLVFDTQRSILARVLQAYSKPFWQMLSEDGSDKQQHPHLIELLSLVEKARCNEWEPEIKLLPELLFHLLIFEKPEEADSPTAHEREVAINYDSQPARRIKWGIGPAQLRQALHVSWYQPFRHDIIGNTLSADLIDYLKRDLCRLGMAREIDLHLLNYFVLINPAAKDFVRDKPGGGRGSAEVAMKRPTRYRCAIEILDQRRGTSRVVLINDIFRLLDLRHEIHEKAVMHRVVQSANAMLARALLLMRDRLPSPQSLAKFGEKHQALQGEDLFLNSLLTALVDSGKPLPDSIKDSVRIIEKLIDRRVYRPLLVIPGDRAAKEFAIKGNADEPPTDVEYRLRTLGALLDSQFYSPFLLFVSTCVEEFLTGIFDTDSQLLDQVGKLARDPSRRKKAMEHVPSRVIIWTTPYKQLYKDPGLIVALRSKVDQIDELASSKANVSESESALIELVKASVSHADSKYANLWKIYVFISDGIYYTGILNKLLHKSPSEQGQAVAAHTAKLKKCEAMVVAAIDAMCENWSHYCGDHPQTGSRGECLNGEMSDSNFEALIELWIPKYKNINLNNPTRGLSEVDIEQYVHDWSGSGFKEDDKCRDIRYKYPTPAVNAWTNAKSTSAPLAERQLVKFLEACGVTMDELSEAEFEQLGTQVDGEFESLYGTLIAGNGKTLHRSDLKTLWRSAILPDALRHEASVISEPVEVPAKTTSKSPQIEFPAPELFKEHTVDALPATWPLEMFPIPSDEQLAKVGRSEGLKRTIEASRNELVKALAELSPNYNQAIVEKSGHVWSAFLAPLSKAAARKGTKAKPDQEFRRSKDEWLNALAAKDEL